MLLRSIAFLVLNFAALALGGLFAGPGAESAWYESLNKAPWTPPGWFFGLAWTTIMVCFALYMAQLWDTTEDKKHLIFIYGSQWVLNVSWNPVFFYFHQAKWGLLIIITLTLIVGYLLFNYRRELRPTTWFITPYFVWLLVATSLNGYILFCN